MALPREASSLSSITQLAGNPPRNPRNLTERKRDSLILYIARVPGSRDVILMTMKPRLKNVTAEDVLNCLYYLHVDKPEDVLLLETHADMSDAEVTQGSSTARIARKPLLEDSSLLDPSVFSTLPSKSESGNLNSLGKPEIPPRNLQMPPLPERPSPERRISPALRPLGPRALHSQPQLSQRPFPSIENAPLRDNNVSVVSPRQFNIITSQSRSSKSADSLPGVSNICDIQIPILNTAATSTSNPLSIRLIRRDPTSGSQWNIGNIQCRSHLHPNASNSVKLSSSVFVHLTTLGYGQFQSNQEGGINEATSKLNESRVIQASFDRQIRMDWSSQWGGKFKQHQQENSDQSSDRQSARIRDSNEFSGIKHESYGIPNPHIPKVPNCGFISPWNGLCEFSSGSSGRTLKCKHILSSNMTVASSTKAAVSELRFNLPSNVYSRSSNNPGRSSRPYPQHMRSKSSVDSSISPRSSKSDPTSYAAMYPSEDDEEEDEDDDSNGGLDPLSLGRERAGGGIRGKRVKLGKLIVHDEGLKMLDLVVAANMGIWWTIWDG